ncbi:hypothetical protein LEP1GSC073_4391 [Leptospira noguchii str. Cascata]|nr:hypothetical protein LEP1GSC073_4391 [Leptospira noguchii str. Cascata]
MIHFSNKKLDPNLADRFLKCGNSYFSKIFSAELNGKYDVDILHNRQFL